MLHIHVYTAGKAKGPVKLLLDEYEKRLNSRWRLSWHIAKTGDKKSENAYFKNQLADKKYIALDLTGSSITTDGIAAYISGAEQHAANQIRFLIGGAYGIEQDILDAAEAVWSFGGITLPHQIARILLIEQLYRADCLLRGHPYHH